MRVILALAAAVAALAHAGALCAEPSQRPQGRALQAPAQPKAKASPRDEKVALPRPKPKDIRAKASRTKERSKTEQSATRATAKGSGERKSAPATARRSGTAPITSPQPPTAPAGSKPSTPVEEAPQPPITWSTDEVLAARARCVELLGPITAEVTVGPAVLAGACGAPSPVIIKSIGTRVRVEMRPPVTLNCNMVAALHAWLDGDVQPAAQDLLGEEITAVSGAVGYQCRNRSDTGRTSEHGFGNAIDILGFVTRSGRRVSVLDDWGPTEEARLDDEPSTSGHKVQKQSKAGESPPAATPAPRLAPERSKLPTRPSAPADPVPPAERSESSPAQRFLKRIHHAACFQFATVLGPDANQEHRNHFHLDLAQRRSKSSYCR